MELFRNSGVPVCTCRSLVIFSCLLGKTRVENSKINFFIHASISSMYKKISDLISLKQK
jgi:hypothetical protein